MRLDGTFGVRRMLPLHELWSDGFGLRTAFSSWQVEDSPELSTGRHAVEDGAGEELLALRGAATFASAA